ncbi:ABC-2 type transport system permease protein [Streptomyces sp. SolWspMP-sol7th]|nr:ABC-2 type transport system permease protein [Streptomyces sp. SolWspMP-sol7th]
MSAAPIEAATGTVRTPGPRRGSGPTTEPAPLAPRARLLPALGAVYRAQLSRARVARIPLLFVATFQSVGIMILMRGVVDGGDEARAVVAGSAVLVVAFVALNLLAQYFGQLRATGGLDHYATLPVPPSAVVLGAAGAYASFTAPGTLVTALIGCGLFGLPVTHVWILLAVVPLAGAALAGLGAAFGLLAPRPELATLLGQLGMSAALLLGVLPADHLPEPIQWCRDLAPLDVRRRSLREDLHGAPRLARGPRRPRRLRGGRGRLARGGDVGVPARGGRGPPLNPPRAAQAVHSVPRTAPLERPSPRAFGTMAR